MLLSRLSEQLASISAKHLVVGYSGGQDSQVLLAALIKLKQQQHLPPVSAIHINHNLQAQAASWQQHCERFCAANNIHLTVVQVAIEGNNNIEAKARQARFSAFAKHLSEGDALLLAQHQQDQSETVLYRLMRGAGVQGLAAIYPEREWNNLRVLRPLLGVSKEAIASFAKKEGLSFVEDPSNKDEHFDRNYIRQRVMPVLQSRWPKAAQSLAQVASHQQEAQTLLTDLAKIDLANTNHHSQLGAALNPAFINCQALMPLTPARQKNALMHFFKKLGLVLSQNSWHKLLALFNQGLEKGQIVVAGATIECFKQTLYVLPNNALPSKNTEEKWHTAKAFNQQGQGVWSVGDKSELELTVGFRKGGEVLLVNGQHQKVKKLLQQANIPPFQRELLPYFYYQGQLIAVGNVLFSDAGKALVSGKLNFKPEIY